MFFKLEAEDMKNRSKGAGGEGDTIVTMGGKQKTVD